MSPPPSSPKTSRPSRLWPDTAFGNLIYLVVMGGGGLLGWSLGASDSSLQGPLWVLPVAMAFSGYMVATIWRNLFINAGAFSPDPQDSTTDGVPAVAGAAGSGGISWKAVFWVVVSVMVSGLAKELFWDLP